MEAMNKFKKEQMQDTYHVQLSVRWRNNILELYGKEEAVSKVKTLLEDVIKCERKKASDTDSAWHYPDFNAIAFPQRAVSKFGPGLKWAEVKKIGSENSESCLRTWFGAQSSHWKRCRVFEDYRYWNVKEKRGKSFVTIFINSGNNASIFNGILKNYLPPGQYECKVGRDGTKIDISSRFGAVGGNMAPRVSAGEVNDIINRHSSAFLPEIVDMSSLTVPVAGKPSTQVWGYMWKCISREWASGSPFWRNFCTVTEKQTTFETSIKYVPSRHRFEIYATQEHHRMELKQNLTEQLVRMCKMEYCGEHRPSLAKYKKYELRKVVATIEEIRLRCPSIRFTIFFKSSASAKQKRPPSLTYDSEYVVEEELMNSDTEKETTLLHWIISAIEFFDGTDFDHVESLCDQNVQIVDLFIMLQNPSAANNKKLRSAQALLERFLPSKIVSPVTQELVSVIKDRSEPEKHRCYLCRRTVVLDEKEMNTKKTSPAAYDNEVQCQRCDTTILSRDCLRIVTRNLRLNKNTPTKLRFEAEQYQIDWTILATLSCQKFCSDLAEGVAYKDSMTCLDCRSVMIFDKGAPFLDCRNSRCSIRMCATCGRVPLSACAFERCKNGECAN
eukprot:scaffold85671_cov54-Attheya_sp.AAC.4